MVPAYGLNSMFTWFLLAILALCGMSLTQRLYSHGVALWPAAACASLLTCCGCLLLAVVWRRLSDPASHLPPAPSPLLAMAASGGMLTLCSVLIRVRRTT